MASRLAPHPSWGIQPLLCGARISVWLENWPLSCQSSLRFSPWCGQKTGPLNSVAISSLGFGVAAGSPTKRVVWPKDWPTPFLKAKYSPRATDSLTRWRVWLKRLANPAAKKGVANRLATPPSKPYLNVFASAGTGFSCTVLAPFHPRWYISPFSSPVTPFR